MTVWSLSAALALLTARTEQSSLVSKTPKHVVCLHACRPGLLGFKADVCIFCTYNIT